MIDKRDTYMLRQRERGLVKVCVWAPKNRAEEVIALAAKLRRVHLREQRRQAQADA